MSEAETPLQGSTRFKSTKHLLAELFMAGGFALSMSLLYMKLSASGCPISADCANVLESRFGTFLTIPVSAYSLGFWVLAPLLSSRTTAWRATAFALLKWAAVSIAMAFLLIQFFVLRAFCIYCTLHTLCVFGFALLTKNPSGRLLPLGFLLGGALIFHANSIKASSLPATTGLTPQELMRENWVQQAVLPWYLPLKDGDFDLNGVSELAVVSLTCPHCIVYLQKIHRGSEPPPLIAFYADSELAGRLTQATLITTLLQPNAVEKRRVFVAMMDRYLLERESFMAQPELWEQTVAALRKNPGDTAAEVKARHEALRLLSQQFKLIKQLGVGVLPARYHLHQGVASK